jgi:hypothetical protein
MGQWMKYRSWIGYFLLILTPFQGVCRVVLLDVLGGKDVVEGRDGRTDGRVG